VVRDQLHVRQLYPVPNNRRLVWTFRRWDTVYLASAVITCLDTIHWMVFVTQIQLFSVRCVLGSWLLLRYISGLTLWNKQTAAHRSALTTVGYAHTCMLLLHTRVCCYCTVLPLINLVSPSGIQRNQKFDFCVSTVCRQPNEALLIMWQSCLFC